MPAVAPKENVQCGFKAGKGKLVAICAHAELPFCSPKHPNDS